MMSFVTRSSTIAVAVGMLLMEIPRQMAEAKMLANRPSKMQTESLELRVRPLRRHRLKGRSRDLVKRVRILRSAKRAQPVIAKSKFVCALMTRLVLEKHHVARNQQATVCSVFSIMIVRRVLAVTEQTLNVSIHVPVHPDKSVWVQMPASPIAKG